MEWKLYTTKQLNRTLPFDTDSAIRFVREVRVSESNLDPSHRENDNGSLTGEEARSIYESIVSSENSSDPSKERLERTNRHTKRGRDTSVVKAAAEPTSQVTDVTSDQLFRFAQDGDLQKLSKALSTGCYDVNITDQYDWTLLMIAATEGHMTIVQYLMDYGAMWKGLVDRRGMDATDLARTRGYNEIAEYIINYEHRALRNKEHTSLEEHGSVKLRGMSFHCSVCQRVIQDSSVSSHTVSIPHQFCTEHKPSSLPYGLPETNRGFQMMLRSGWHPDKGLGSEGQGRQFPVKTVLKRDRLGVGNASSSIPRVTHFRPGDISAIKSERRKNRRDNGKRETNKKERMKNLRKERQWEINIRQYMSTDYYN